MPELVGHRPFTPRMPAEKWAAIAPYVLDVVARVEPLVSYSTAELNTPVAQLVAFAHGEFMPLEDEEVWAPETVERFVQFHMGSNNPASKSTIRARLRRVSEALLGEETAGAFRALGKAEASRPYSVKEIAALEAWTGWQTSKERRTSAGALLALGFGAGLTGAEIIGCRVEDIDLDLGAVAVMGTGAEARRRRVPVFADWIQPLRDRVAFTGGTGWVFRADQRGGNENLITDFVSRKPPEVQLRARQMRATWLVRHLDERTSLKVLLRIAGLESAEALDRVLPFAADNEAD